MLDLKDSILYPVLVNSVKNWADKTNNEGNVRGKLAKLISNTQSVMDGENRSSDRLKMTRRINISLGLYVVSAVPGFMTTLIWGGYLNLFRLLQDQFSCSFNVIKPSRCGVDWPL